MHFQKTPIFCNFKNKESTSDNAVRTYMQLWQQADPAELMNGRREGKERTQYYWDLTQWPAWVSQFWPMSFSVAKCGVGSNARPRFKQQCGFACWRSWKGPFFQQLEKNWRHIGFRKKIFMLPFSVMQLRNRLWLLRVAALKFAS